RFDTRAPRHQRHAGNQIPSSFVYSIPTPMETTARDQTIRAIDACPKKETPMLNARSIIPPRGNPAREPFIVCLVGFTAMAILFNVVIPLMGVSTEGDLFFNLALISIAAIFLWLIRNQGQHAEKDRARLV